jgi:hypothetical protein
LTENTTRAAWATDDRTFSNGLTDLDIDTIEVGIEDIDFLVGSGINGLHYDEVAVALTGSSSTSTLSADVFDTSRKDGTELKVTPMEIEARLPIIEADTL